MPTAMMLTAPPGELTGKDLTPGPGSSIIFAAAALISKLFNPARLPARASSRACAASTRALAAAHWHRRPHSKALARRCHLRRERCRQGLQGRPAQAAAPA